MGKYDNLLSPIMVGNRLFKNRICMTPTTPRLHQDTEGGMGETIMEHYLQRARAGAALITLSGTYQFDETNPAPASMYDYFIFDVDSSGTHYYSQLCEGIHAFGAYVTTQMQHSFPATHDICKGAIPFDPSFSNRKPAEFELTEYDLKKSTEELIRKCVRLKEIGLDGVMFHMSYRLSLLGRSLSPITNKRTDKYGGSFENRIRLLLETCEGIKKACGKDFLIDGHITGEERDGYTGELVPGGWTLEDSKNLVEAVSGYMDIIHLRGWDMDEQHPTWYRPDRPPYLYIAEKCKEAVTDTKILCTSGNKNPEMMDAIIRDGQADLIGIARSVVADPDYIKKIYEDRVDDIRPCIRCNKCLGWTPTMQPRTDRCAINPLWGGYEARKPVVFPPATDVKNVLVVGGGPAGMEAAINCRERGHNVTLCEAGPKLGGQLNFADYSEAKWTLRNYRDFLIHQLDKRGVTVKLNTKVTPEMLDGSDYDAVIAALGSKPRILNVPGADGDNVFTISEVYGNEEKLGKKVVFIGAGMTAFDTALHLRDEYGCDVTLLDIADKVISEAPPTHYRAVFMKILENSPDLHAFTEAFTQRITEKSVIYKDKDGAEHEVEADSVVMACGSIPLVQDAIALHGHGPRLITIGDARKVGSIMDLVRDAYFACAQL